MRILQVVHQYPPQKIGGTEIYTQNLSRALKNKGHEVIVFRRGETSAERRLGMRVGSDGLEVYTLYDMVARNPLSQFLSSFRNPFVDESFTEVLEEEAPDLIHFQHLKGLSNRLIVMAKERGIPTVLTLHDYWFICPNAQLLRWGDNKLCPGPRLWLNCAYSCAAPRVGFPAPLFPGPLAAGLFAYRDRLLRKALAATDLIICPTEFVRSIFLRWGLPKEKVRLIEHGIEPPIDSLPGRAKDGLNFLYLGGIAWQKGLHTLIQAFQSLGSVSATLAVCGDEQAFPDYARALREMVGDSSITFRGLIPRSQLWSTLAQADVVVIPSLWYEVSPLVVEEAFAAGVPVIASGIGALAEKVRHGVDGFLFPPGDVAHLSHLLREIVANPSILEGLRNNIQRVKTLEEHVGEIEALYARLGAQKEHSD